MNSSLALVLLLLATSCGVKGPPRAPREASVPSIEENYPELNLAPGTISPVRAN